MLNCSPHYYPFDTGKYTTSPGLSRLGTQFGNPEADGFVFQLDQNWEHYLTNKQQCSDENIRKYYCKSGEDKQVIASISKFIANELADAYPNEFKLDHCGLQTCLKNKLTGESIIFNENGQLADNSTYVDVLDALAFQIQEDLAIWQATSQGDYMSCIHLCAPNHWSPSDKIGRPFSYVHNPVADMDKLHSKYKPMLNSLIHGSTFVRFAWGLATDTQLNHHPQPPPTIEEPEWHGRYFDADNPQLYVRVERQTLSGFLKEGAVLFTIKTYFEDVNTLNGHRKQQLYSALKSMSEKSIKYKGLSEEYNEILDYLKYAR